MEIAIIIYFSGAKIILFAQTKKKKNKKSLNVRRK